MYIWGANESGQKAYKKLCNKGAKIDGFIDEYLDNKTIKIGAQNFQVLKTREIREKSEQEEVRLVIASSAYEEIIKSICDTNIEILGIYDKRTDKVDLYEYKYADTVYSQDGEELLLKQFYRGKKDGVYVDVGALHPFRFSNTYWAYKIGWRGINIEPNVDQMGLFKKFRPEDINLNIGIGNQDGYIDYYKYVEPAYNGFDREVYGEKGLVAVEKVPIRKLGDILEENHIQEIDFMSIDVEGYELEVLMSNNWKKYRPEWILIEDVEFCPENFNSDRKCCFLKEQGYKFHSKYNRTVFWKIKSDNI